MHKTQHTEVNSLSGGGRNINKLLVITAVDALGTVSRNPPAENHITKHKYLSIGYFSWRLHSHNHGETQYD